MAEWYSWQDLLYLWNKQDFELLELIKKGLQPFSEYGNPISFQSIFPKSGDKDAADEKEGKTEKKADAKAEAKAEKKAKAEEK